MKGGQYETYGYFIHRIGGVFAGVIPKWIKRLLAKYASYEMMVDYKRKVWVKNWVELKLIWFGIILLFFS